MINIVFAKDFNFLANNKNISINLKNQFFLKCYKLYLNNVFLKKQ